MSQRAAKTSPFGLSQWTADSLKIQFLFFHFLKKYDYFWNKKYFNLKIVFLEKIIKI